MKGILLFIFSTIVLIGYSQEAEPWNFSPEGQKLTFEEVRDSIHSIMQNQDIPGISMAIVSERDSLFWSGGFGMANIKEDKPMTKHSTLFVASLSKNLLALGIMKLVEQGKLKLSQPIVEIVPEINFQNPWSGTHPISVEMVLEHTTGFDDTRYNNFIGPDNFILPLKELLNRYPNALDSRWKPGTMFSYSNLNYTLAGYIIEKISGQSFEDFLSKEIIQPLGMTQTMLSDFTKPSTELAIPYGYDFKNQRIVPFFPEGIVGKNFLQRPASFLITTADDMLKYIKMYLSDGKDSTSIISPALIDRMENGETGYHSKLKLPGRYGLGNKPGLREVRLFGHNGTAWNQAFFLYNRQEGIGYYLATNCGYPIPEIRRLLNQFLLQHKKASQKPLRDAEQVKVFEGFYEVVTSRNEIMLFFDQFRFAGRLKVQNDTVYFNGGLKPRKYQVLATSTKALSPGS